jgi:hypothetical protein
MDWAEYACMWPFTLTEASATLSARSGPQYNKFGLLDDLMSSVRAGRQGMHTNVKILYVCMCARILWPAQSNTCVQAPVRRKLLWSREIAEV